MASEPKVDYSITEPHQITRKYIFTQKLKGEPILIPWSSKPWMEAMKHLSILVECYILEADESRDGRYWVRYPVIMHGSDHAANNDKWHELPVGQRICEPGDIWEL